MALFPLGQGAVEAMYLEEGELITAGADGFVKVQHTVMHTHTTHSPLHVLPEHSTPLHCRYGTMKPLTMPTSPRTALCLKWNH